MQKSLYRYIQTSIWAIFLSLTLISSSFATWNKIFQFPYPICSCYFLDANHGVAGSGVYGPNYTLQIWVTTNGGISWTQAGVPSGDGEVTQLVIRPDGTGYASIFSEHNPKNNLWSTTDGGYSWKDISSGDHLGTGTAYGGNPISFWTDNIAKNSNTNGVFIADGDTVITPGPNGPVGEAWSAYCDTVHHIWYKVAEIGRMLYYSTDGGKNWTPRFNFGPLLINGGLPTGNIVGAGGRLYIQTEKNGMFRGSINDTGASWVHLMGSPSNEADSRTIYISGCNGQTIFAFDDAGNLWRSDDGGDGTLTAGYSLKIKHINFTTITSCQTAKNTGWITNLGCPPFIITNVTLLGNTAGVYTLTQKPNLPDTLNGDTAFFPITFNPAQKPGGYNTTTIDIQGYFEATEGQAAVDVDSIITVKGVAQAVPPNAQGNIAEIDFAGQSICGGKADSTFTIKNIGCDTMQIFSGPGSLDPAFTIDNIPLPYTLPPDSSVVIHVHFRPTVAGSVSSPPEFGISAQGLTSKIQFTLTGSGIPGVGVLSAGNSTFNFGTLSICDGPDSLTGYLTNTGCGPLEITDSLFGNDPRFSISVISQPSSEITPGDTLYYKIIFSPHIKGAASAGETFIIQDKNGVGPTQRITVTAAGLVTDGKPVINASVSSIDFGKTTLCDEKDSLITFFNSGCDTLIITGIGLAGKSFSFSGVTLPLRIPPGDSSMIALHTLLDTAGGKLTMSDSLHITSNSTRSLDPISLTRSVIPHREVGMYLDASAQRGTDLGIVYYDLKETPGKTFTGAGITKLGFDLPRNSDLLEFVQSKSSAIISGLPNGMNFSLANNPEITADQNGVLATIAFRVYLTKDSITDISLANVKPTGGVDTTLGPCSMTLSYSGTAHFNYDFVCGEASIQGFMNGVMPTKIISVRPNPAQDEIIITLDGGPESSLSAQSAARPTAVSLFDLFGREVHSEIDGLSPGRNDVRIDTRGLAGGIYLVRVGTVSQSFVKIR